MNIKHEELERVERYSKKNWKGMSKDMRKRLMKDMNKEIRRGNVRLSSERKRESKRKSEFEIMQRVNRAYAPKVY